MFLFVFENMAILYALLVILVAVLDTTITSLYDLTIVIHLNIHKGEYKLPPLNVSWRGILNTPLNVPE